MSLCTIYLRTAAHSSGGRVRWNTNLNCIDDMAVAAYVHMKFILCTLCAQAAIISISTEYIYKQNESQWWRKQERETLTPNTHNAQTTMCRRHSLRVACVTFHLHWILPLEVCAFIAYNSQLNRIDIQKNFWLFSLRTFQISLRIFESNENRKKERISYQKWTWFFPKILVHEISIGFDSPHYKN